METNIIDVVFQQLRNEVGSVSRRVRSIAAHSERAETASGTTAVLFADLPNAAGGAGPGDLKFVINGRKSGEGAGVGTGVPAYFNSGTNTWKRFEDNADVVI